MKSSTKVGSITVNNNVVSASESLSNFDENQEDFFVNLNIFTMELELDLMAIRQLKALLCDAERRLLIRHKEALLKRNLVLDL